MGVTVHLRRTHSYIVATCSTIYTVRAAAAAAAAAALTHYVLTVSPPSSSETAGVSRHRHADSCSVSAELTVLVKKNCQLMGGITGLGTNGQGLEFRDWGLGFRD